MRLDFALATILPQKGWSKHTGEFDPRFVELVFDGYHFGAKGLEDALGKIDEECDRIEQQVRDDRSDMRISDLRLLPRTIYLEALRLMVSAIELVGADFDIGKDPPKFKGLSAEDDCRRLLDWARRLFDVARDYRQRHTVD
jgi:hypothetical protein